MHVPDVSGSNPSRSNPTRRADGLRPAPQRGTGKTTGESRSIEDRLELSETGLDLSQRLPGLLDALRDANTDRAERLANLKERLRDGEFDMPKAFFQAATNLHERI